MGRHLVTGGNGYVGTFIARALVARGEKVRCLDITENYSPVEGAEHLRTDVLDMTALRKAVEGVDYIHHTAALVPLKKAGSLFWKVNVEGTRNVVTAAQEAGVAHVTHMSSSAVFGSVHERMCPITAATRPRPAEVYGRSKLAAEEIVRNEMSGDAGTTFSVIRPRTIIGKERLGIFQVLFEWVSEGRNIYIIGDGSNRFQFVHIDDIVNVSIETALERKQGIFNIGTDRYGTLRQALNALCHHAATGSKVVGLPVTLTVPALWLSDKLGVSPLAPWHYLTYHRPFYFDLSYEFRELRWRPRYSNEEMLSNAYDWYLTNRRTLLDSSMSSLHRGKLRQGILGMIKKWS